MGSCSLEHRGERGAWHKGCTRTSPWLGPRLLVHVSFTYMYQNVLVRIDRGLTGIDRVDRRKKDEQGL